MNYKRIGNFVSSVQEQISDLDQATGRLLDSKLSAVKDMTKQISLLLQSVLKSFETQDESSKNDKSSGQLADSVPTIGNVVTEELVKKAYIENLTADQMQDEILKLMEAKKTLQRTVSAKEVEINDLKAQLSKFTQKRFDVEKLAVEVSSGFQVSELFSSSQQENSGCLISYKSEDCFLAVKYNVGMVLVEHGKTLFSRRPPQCEYPNSKSIEWTWIHLKFKLNSTKFS